jgi:hypothetical protein
MGIVIVCELVSYQPQPNASTLEIRPDEREENLQDVTFYALGFADARKLQIQALYFL